jgi:HlyD family secretion protein
MIKWLIRRGFQTALLLLVVGGLVYAFLPKPVPVDVAEVVRGPLRVTVDEDGKTRIRERYVVAAPLSGQMLRVGLKAGDRVAAGQTILAVLEPSDPSLLDDRARAETEARVKAADSSRKQADAKLERARAAHKQAAAELARARQMLITRSTSQQEHESAVHHERIAAEELRAAQFAVQIADFELELARVALVRTRPRSPGDVEPWRVEIRSPINGQVLRVHQESATVVTPGLRLLELGDAADLEAEIDVLSHDAVKIAPGARVLLEHWGGDQPLNGRVRLVEPGGFLKISALGVEEQRVNIIIDFTDPPEKYRRLGDAYRVEARIVIWEGDDVLKVPAGALFRKGDGWAVFVAADGKAELRPVQLGHGNGMETEVLDGLDKGESVILHPSDKIKAGTAVVLR